VARETFPLAAFLHAVPGVSDLSAGAASAAISKEPAEHVDDSNKPPGG